MQFDREGTNDTKTAEKVESTDRQETINLTKHFLENGLSQSAYNKIAPEIENGDMNVNILIDCNDNDLNTVANQYNFTFLQKKAFIKAANLLKLNNNKNSDTDTGTKNKREDKFIHIYVSPQEQSILNDISGLTQLLIKYNQECVDVKKNNTNQIKLSILKLQNYKQLLIQCIDQEINKLVKKVCY